jgi:hypothetical protein
MYLRAKQLFDLELRNETELLPSQVSDAITYQLSVDPASNPDGLVVLLNGKKFSTTSFDFCPVLDKNETDTYGVWGS